MIRVKAEVQYLIVVVIFILSVYVAVNKSGLNKKETEKIDFDFSKTEKIFDEKLNYKKVSYSFQTNDLDKFYQEINQTLVNSNYEEIYSLRQGSFFVGMFEIPADDKSTVSSLRNISGLKSETAMKNNELKKMVNIESSLENYRNNKRELQDQLSSKAVSTTSKRQLREDLDKVQSKIDSLVYLPTLIERSKSYDLIYVTAIRDSNNNVSRKKIINFIKIFLLLLIVQLLGLVLLYLFLVFVTWLLKKLGIKTKRSSSNYNYNNYYSRGQKKVKRKYKDESDKMADESKE